MLDTNAVQEQLSLAHVRAVGAICRFSIEPRAVDLDGVDLSIHAKGFLVPDAELQSPQLDVQAKATVNLVEEKERLGFDLKVENYHRLCGPTPYAVPRVLVVLALPRAEPRWLTWRPDQMVLRRTAWWVSLEDQPPTTNEHSVRVWLPRGQHFSPAALHEIMRRISLGESLVLEGSARGQ